MASEKRPVRAVSRKPGATQDNKESAPTEEAAIHAFISEGGSVAAKPSNVSATTESKEVRINFRLPGDMAEEVDMSVKSRRIRISRNTWLLEAVQEKLDREAT